MEFRRSLRGMLAFAISFAFVESSVVVYLRDLYYPGGFEFPLRPIRSDHLLVELVREGSTIVMLLAAGWLAGRTRWQRTAWFMIAFGVWDLFYYIWLKAILDWPASVFDWDILFLIPVPWIGPVLAPCLVSVILVVSGILIVRREEEGERFQPPKAAWWMAIGGTACVLYTFVRDTGATLELRAPEPYWYWLFAVGMLCYGAAMVQAFWPLSHKAA